ncbi:MAG: UDP-glucose/GDP-mannose dehydrogenase family protein [Candidatus Omnitrophica bacterium]|nr:UDP-glucose/GDP-mannose dehydrogenase family protein [Candidatus Omnitrophota bacterium]
MNICVIGTGYVGLVTGTCFAELGNKVVCVDIDKSKINSLKKGKVTIYEPGLKELVKRNLRQKRLLFTTSIKAGMKNAQIIFIAVGTPPKPSGEADLTYVENVCCQIANNMTSYKLIVEKSTVPIETGEWVEQIIKQNLKRKVSFDVASNPEFLSEGSAIDDFMHPDRIVIGVETKKAKGLLAELYRPLRAPIIVTNIKSAEIIKHASNSFLATKISFINAISNICEKTGADVIEVARGMGMDKRIGKAFLNAGAGFGGFCFPKDLLAFVHICEKLGYDFGLLREVDRINTEQKAVIIGKIKQNLQDLDKKVVGVLGLSFKPNTDDIRYAPAIDIIRILQSEGAKIKAYDPKAMKRAKKELKGIQFCKSPYAAAEKSDCLILITEWNEFKELDFTRIKKLLNKPFIMDCRNIYDPKKMKRLGFKYIGIGRNK